MQVLAPELGWRPVTLTDLITSSQVKIAYKKAALCVHPDKVQQKGASLEQKFVAEKVFDLLKVIYVQNLTLLSFHALFIPLGPYVSE